QVGDVSADGLRKIEVQAGSGDVVARLVDMVRATIGDDWVEAGTIIEVGFEDADPAKPFANYLIAASRFVIYDPNTGDRFLPLAFEGGELIVAAARLAVADIGLVTAGVIMDEEGYFITDYNNRYLLISDDT